MRVRPLHVHPTSKNNTFCPVVVGSAVFAMSP